MLVPIRSYGWMIFGIFVPLYFFLSPNQTFAASDVIFLPYGLERDSLPGAQSLVEHPNYGLLEPDEKSDDMAKEIQKFMEPKRCRPTDLPFEKMEDVNSHPYFPDLQHNPIRGDHLGAFFFKEIKTGKFIVKHWARDQFPIVYHLTDSVEIYRPWIQEVVDYINVTAQRNGIVFAGENLIALSNETKEFSDENCDNHLILAAKYWGSTLMVNFLVAVEDDENRLGEIVDSDILIFADNEKKYRAGIEKRGFQRDLIHEFLHGLGLAHNFALGSVMGYNENEEIALIRPENDITPYEIDTLKYLILETVSQIPWALARTLGGILNFEKYIPEGSYPIYLDQSTVTCTNFATKKISEIPILVTSMNLTYDADSQGGKMLIDLPNLSLDIKRIPSNFLSEDRYLGFYPILGDIKARFSSPNSHFLFFPLSIDGIQNRISAHIDTGFKTLNPKNENYIDANWSVLDDVGGVVESCRLLSTFTTTNSPVVSIEDSKKL